MQELKCFVLISLGYFILIQSGNIGGEMPRIEINWTRSGIANFKPNTPLNMTLGSLLIINCINRNYSTIYVLTDRRQYDMCRCSAIEAGCVSSQLVSQNCHPEVGTVHVPINNSQGINSSFRYTPGAVFYLASFPNSTKEGGPCLPTNTEPGMRMAIAIASTSFNGSVLQSQITGSALSIPTSVPTLSNSVIIIAAAGSFGGLALIAFIMFGIIFMLEIRDRKKAKKKMMRRKN